MSNSIAPGSSADVNVKVTALTTNPNVPAQYKTVILKKNLVNGVNTLTQEMMSATNTKYVVKYDYTLGEDITVPAGCILEFDGGSISGAYQLTMNNCYIEGNAKFGSGTTFSGTIKNGFFNPLWITDSDFGDKINRASQYFYNLYVPPVTIEYNTPIYIGCDKGSVVIDANLIFTGVPTNNGAALTIAMRYSKFRLHCLTMENYGITKLQWNINRTLNFIGIKFLNCLDNIVEITRVQGFNECIRLHAINTSCSGNYFHIGSIYDFNYAIRTYQENQDNYESGWCHENTFVGQGEIRRHQLSAEVLEEKYCFYLAGPNADPVSYKDQNAVDERDGVNAITIRGFDVENCDYPIYARNATGLIIDGVREENDNGLFIIDGNFGLAEYTSKYEDILNGSIVSKCGHIYNFPTKELLNYKQFEYRKENDGATAYGQFVLFDMDNQNIKFSGSLDKFRCGIGVLVTRQAFINFFMEGEGMTSESRFIVAYIDDKFNNITETIKNQYPNNTTHVHFYYNSTLKICYTEANHNWCMQAIPNEVEYVFIGIDPIRLNLNLPIIINIGTHITPTIYGTEIPKACATADRPTGYVPNYITIFDTTLNKYIKKGTSNTGWVDLVGNEV